MLDLGMVRAMFNSTIYTESSSGTENYLIHYWIEHEPARASLYLSIRHWIPVSGLLSLMAYSVHGTIFLSWLMDHGQIVKPALQEHAGWVRINDLP